VVIRVMRRKAKCRHMTGDPHGQGVGCATLLVRGVDAILGTHRCHREDPGPPPPRDEQGQRGEPGPVGGVVPHPAGVPAQYCVLVPKHQKLGVLRAVPAGHQHNQPEQPAHQPVSDLQGHPASQPPQRQAGSQ